MNTVIVTRLASDAPARSSVRFISANTVRTCSSNWPLMSRPSRSVVAVWPASHTVRPPSVTTAGEKARLFWCSVPSRCWIFAGMGPPWVERYAQVTIGEIEPAFSPMSVRTSDPEVTIVGHRAGDFCQTVNRSC